MKVSSLHVPKVVSRPRTDNPESVATSPTEILIELKHDEYVKMARLFQTLYYSTRLLAGLSAGLLPFVVSVHPEFALSLSIVIVVCTVVDMVFGVKDRWQLMSKAANVLTIRRLELSGDYEKYRSIVDVLANTESAKLEKLVDMDSLLKKTRDGASNL